MNNIGFVHLKIETQYQETEELIDFIIMRKSILSDIIKVHSDTLHFCLPCVFSYPFFNNENKIKFTRTQYLLLYMHATNHSIIF